MTTHLVHVPLDIDALRRWALARGLVGRAPFDAGYSLHVLLSAMFGKSVLQPFRIFASARRRVAALYAYTETDAAALRQVASLAATPDWLAVLDPGELRTKLMPESFASDQRLGFDVRVRPVRRSQRDCPGRTAKRGRRKGGGGRRGRVRRAAWHAERRVGDGPPRARLRRLAR